MFYGLHTTKKAERDLLLSRPGELITIEPAAFHRSHHKPIIIEEDTGKMYEHSISAFLNLCQCFSVNRDYNYRESQYCKDNMHKFHDVEMRMKHLPALIKDIQENGITEPVHCEVTGERLDGSYRTKIALFLGIPAVQAVLHRFKWTDIDEAFIERKLKARWASSGKDYYEFKYGAGPWANIPEGGEVYRENAERAAVIVPLIQGKTVLDVGCNEGYIGLQAARAGHTVEGIDIDWTHVAYLNRLIFEFIEKRDLPVEFYEENLLDTNRTADTILLLNVLYHVPKELQAKFLEKFRGKQLIFQCNLRKEAEREKYFTSHPDDLKKLLQENGWTIAQEIKWPDKPIIIAV